MSLIRRKSLTPDSNKIKQEENQRNKKKLTSKQLDLSRKNIENIPDFISEMSQIKQLYLQNNRISSLSLCLSSSIRVLNLSHNLLKEIPSTIFSLYNLKSLHLSHNIIQIIPSQISLLQSLEKLTLHNNNLTKVSCDISLLEKLHTLSLHNNNFLISPPSSVIQMGIKAILDFFECEKRKEVQREQGVLKRERFYVEDERLVERMIVDKHLKENKMMSNFITKTKSVPNKEMMTLIGEENTPRFFSGWRKENLKIGEELKGSFENNNRVEIKSQKTLYFELETGISSTIGYRPYMEDFIF